MDEFEDEPRSLPCSAEEAKYMPVMVQLHLVDAALGKDSRPREDFYRQYSVTPERQTPEEERTPPPPIYSRGALAKLEKEWALSVAKALKQFYAGRVLIRKFEAEQPGVLAEDPEYWSSKASEWQDEGWRLLVEIGGREQMELNGEAEEGYALEMLASPLQPRLPSSDDEFSQVATNLHKDTIPSSDLLSNDTRPSQLHAEASHEPSQTASNHNPNSPARSLKVRKRAVADANSRGQENSDQIRRTKRQPRAIIAADHKQEPVPTTETAREPGRNVSKASRASAKARPRRKNVSKFSSAPRSLPWKLRSRGTLSNRQTGVKTNA